MKKQFFSLTLALFSLFILSTSPLYAQTTESNCIVTKVGNPLPDAPGCGGSGTGTTGPCGTVVEFAQQINDNLNPNDNLTRPLSSNCGKTTPKPWAPPPQYWCTYTVVDSYNMAGIKGLSGADVVGIHHQMVKDPAKFEFLDYRTNKQEVLKKVKPGYAWFIEGRFGVHVSGQQHTGIVKSIAIDDRGNGTIVTLESNGGKKSRTWQVALWDVQHGDKRGLVAFGGAK